MEDMEEIRAEIELYKKWRNVLQFGDWYRLYEEADKKSVYDKDVIRWNMVSADKSKAVGIMLQGETLANYSHHVFKTRGLDDAKKYHFYNRALKYDIHRMGDLINTMAPVHVRSRIPCCMMPYQNSYVSMVRKKIKWSAGLS